MVVEIDVNKAQPKRPSSFDNFGQSVGTFYDTPDTRPAPTFIEEADAYWKSMGYHTAQEYAKRKLTPAQEGYDPTQDMTGYEDMSEWLSEARSPEEMRLMKQQLDRQRRDQDIMNRGQYGILAMLAAGVADPLNIVPIFGYNKGLSLVQNFGKIGGTTAAITAPVEVSRLYTDPYATPGEVVANIAATGILGGAIGGVGGRLLIGVEDAATAGVGFVSHRRKMDNLDRELAEYDRSNLVVQLDELSEGMGIDYRKTESGRIADIETEITGYMPRRGSDNINYIWERGPGWIRQADEGAENPRAAPAEIAAELGTPEPKMGMKLVADPVRARVEFEQGNWRRPGEEKLPDDLIQTADDLVVYRQLERLHEQDIKPRKGEAKSAYEQRIRDKTVKAFEARKTSLKTDPGILPGIGKFIDRVNMSPMAHAIRRAGNSNRFVGHMLQLAGDMGTMIQANKAGMATPASVVLRSQHHHQEFVKLKRVFDQEWNKYIAGDDMASSEKMQWNYGAVVNAANAQWRKRFQGEKILTYGEFADAVGRAVFDKSDFNIKGIPVPKEARAAAKAFTNTFEKYEKMLRERGMFTDQKSLRKRIARDKTALSSIEEKMADLTLRLAGLDYDIAIKTPDGRIWRGKDKAEIEKEIIDELGIDDALTALEDAEFGYYSKTAPQEAPDVTLSVGPQTTTNRPLGYTDPKLIDNYIQDPDQLADAFVAMGKDFPFLELINYPPDRLLAQLDKYLQRMFKDPDFIPDLVDQPLPELTQGRWTGRDILLDVAQWRQVAAETFLDPDNIKAWKESIQTGDKTGADLIDAIRKGYADASENTQRTFFHETIHALRGMGYISKEDWKELTRAVRVNQWRDVLSIDENWENAYKDKGFSKAELEDLYIEEAVAEAFQHWQFSPDFRARYRIDDPETRVFARILAFFQRLAENLNLIAKKVDDTPEWQNIFKRFDEGVTRSDNPDVPLRIKQVDLSQVNTDRFITRDQLIKQNTKKLSPENQKVMAAYEKRRALIQERVANLRSIDAEKLESAHKFVDQLGDPEGYFPRMWDRSAVAAKRDGFERMIRTWIDEDRASRGKPGIEQEQLEDIVNNILTGGNAKDETGTGGFGQGSLTSRSLNIPSSFKIENLAIADYMETNALSVAESYIRRMGVKIEMADAFGDWELIDKKVELFDDLMQDARAQIDRGADADTELNRVEEAMNWHSLTHKAVLGTLKTTDPWRMDNRIARNIRNWTQMAMMGMSTLTSLPEVIRPFMINGMSDGFNSVWLRLSDDMETLRASKEFIEMSGELGDMAMTSFNARKFENLAVEGGYSGGTWFERTLQDLVPGYYKMVGLTPFTVMMKDLTMFAGMHRIMKDSVAVSKGMSSPDVLTRLAALGIDERRANLIASMPFEIRRGGIHQPVIEEWAKSVDGRRAAASMLQAIHAEARRGIVTASVGDKPLIMQGVWASRRGEVLLESDLMTLPLQFMSYSIAAMNKLTLSALQGRDRSAIAGITGMLILGMMTNYLKMPNVAWQSKSIEEKMLEAYEAAGIGGLYFGDINLMIERASGNTMGLRPLFGMDPKYKGATGVSVGDVAGPGIGTMFDLYSAFTDPDATSTDRAQIVRRAIIYNNVIWWKRAMSNLANDIGELAED